MEANSMSIFTVNLTLTSLRVETENEGVKLDQKWQALVRKGIRQFNKNTL